MLGFNNEAFNTLEHFRARNLLNMLAERDLSFSHDAPEELLVEQKMTIYEYSQLQKKLSEADPADEDLHIELMNKMRKLRVRREEIAEKIRKASPKLAALQYPQPFHIDDVKKQLPEGTMFISYSVGKERTLAFVVLDGILEVHSISVSREMLAKKINKYRKFLSSPQSDIDELNAISENLFDLLLSPLMSNIRKSERLLFCTDGPLHFLPIGTLKAEGKPYLAKLKPLTGTVSATVFFETLSDYNHSSEEAKMAIFGNPQYNSRKDDSEKLVIRGRELTALPGSGEEAEAIGHLYQKEQSKVFTGSAASEKNVKAQSEHVDFLHLACHGIIDEDFPMDSGLALAATGETEGENGFLQVWEIFESLHLNARLVTLSACETGLGKNMGGEGIIGLNRAFLYAGAKSVVSSLWSIGDSSTSVLMTKFYSSIQKNKPLDKSLQKAQIKMMKSKDYSHPFYWGGFVLNGNWR